MKSLHTIAILSALAASIVFQRCSPQQDDDGDEMTSIDTTLYEVKFYDSLSTGEPIASTYSSEVTDKQIRAVVSGILNKSNKSLKFATEPTFLDPPISGIAAKKTSTVPLLSALFNSTGTECLSSNRKIRDFAKNRIPGNLKIHSIDSVMSYYEGISGIAILSHFQVKRQNGTIEDYTLAATRVGVGSILDLINPLDANSYVFQMDCSGYFSFALSIAAGRPSVAELKAAGEASSKSTKSSIVAYGMFTSPLAIALKPGSAFNLEFDAATRKQVLQNILGAPGIALADADVITTDNYYYLLITSSSGNSAFNGKADMNGGFGGGIGILRGDFSTTAGGTYSRTVKFTDYNTYVSSRFNNSLSNKTSLTAAEVKQAIAAIKAP